MTTPENKLPSYRRSPHAFDGNEHVKLMSLAAEGAFARLLDHQWLHGSIPADVKQLAVICKHATPREMARLWKEIAPCFERLEGDAARLFNVGLEDERLEQAHFRAQQAERGRKSGIARRRTAEERTTVRTTVQPRLNQETVEPETNQETVEPARGSQSVSHKNPAYALLQRLGDELSAYHPDMLALVDRVSAPDAWVREMEAMLDGMPGHAHSPAPLLAQAVRDFNAVAGTSLPHFRGFVRRANLPPRESQALARDRPPARRDVLPIARSGSRLTSADIDWGTPPSGPREVPNAG